jgi:hypothetical protein
MASEHIRRMRMMQRIYHLLDLLEYALVLRYKHYYWLVKNRAGYEYSWLHELDVYSGKAVHLL